MPGGFDGFDNTAGILTDRALLIKTALLQRMGVRAGTHF